MKYKLNVFRDVDVSGDQGMGNGYVDYILNLPYGFRFSDDLVHVRGYDSMKELRESARNDVVECDCAECVANKRN